MRNAPELRGYVVISKDDLCPVMATLDGHR